jgi:predicted negative regulator of RcsB-dependent stress response
MAKFGSRKRAFVDKPPEFHSMQLRFLQYLKDYWPWAVAGLGVLFLGLVVWGVVNQIQGRRDEKAGAAMARIAPLLSRPESAAEALQDLDKLLKDYPGTPTAREASIFRAHLLYQMQKYGEAAKAYAALQHTLGSGWDALIGESLSYSYEAQGEYRQAVKVLQPVADETAGPFQSLIYQHLAMLLDEAGEPKEAGRYWRKLMEGPHDQALLPYIKEKAAAAAAATPKKK